MSEQVATQGPPTYFANLVTSTLSVDELTMEFRRYVQPHKEWFKPPIREVTFIPPPSPEEIAQIEPVVRVVLTFSAAKAFKHYLDQVFPQIEQQRKTQ